MADKALYILAGYDDRTEEIFVAEIPQKGTHRHGNESRSNESERFHRVLQLRSDRAFLKHINEKTNCRNIKHYSKQSLLTPFK